MTRVRRDDDTILPEVVEVSPEDFPWRGLVLVGAAGIGGLVGLGQMGSWDTFLRWRAAVPFERADPVFGRDLGFYVFTLPVYHLVLDWGFLVVVLGALTAAGIFWVRGALEFGEGMPRLAPSARRHGSTLLGLFLLLKVGSYLLQRYDLLVDATGVVVGAGYTDLRFHLPFLTVLVGLALVGTALCLANLWVGGLRLPALAVILGLAGSLSASFGAVLFQSYRVKPDELRLEAPYLTRSIAGTRYGFALDRLTVKPFRGAHP